MFWKHLYKFFDLVYGCFQLGVPKESQNKIAAMNAELAKLDETLPDDSNPEEPSVPDKVVPLAFHSRHVDIIGLYIHWAHLNLNRCLGLLCFASIPVPHSRTCVAAQVHQS